MQLHIKTASSRWLLLTANAVPLYKLSKNNSSNLCTLSEKEDIALVGIDIIERIKSFKINRIYFSGHMNKSYQWKLAF